VVYEYRDRLVISCSPNERGYEGVFAIRASAEGAKLYFNRGKGLPDPERLLRDAGTQLGIGQATSAAAGQILMIVASYAPRSFFAILVDRSRGHSSPE
jgi:hypothetical protein